MDTASYGELLSQIAKQTQNDVITFIIVLIVMFAVVGIPLYTIYNRNQKAIRDASLKEKEILIGVITENTSAIKSLETTLTLNNQATTEILQDIEERNKHIDEQLMALANSQKENVDKLNQIVNNTDDERSGVGMIWSDVTYIRNKLDKLLGE